MTGTIKANGRQSDRPPLTIYLAAPRGFCAGVDRAIQIVELALAKYGAPVYVRHEIVHNRYVVESLKAKGAIFVEELDEIPDTDAPIVFSAHGVPKAVPEAAESRNLFFLDATCPLVSKVHVEAERQFGEGREILLIGHAGHPEVIGTTGQLPDGAVHLIETADDARRLHPARPRPARGDHPDDALGRRHQGDRERAQGALPAHDHAAQGRHLLRHHQSPGGGEADRARLRPHDRGRLAQQLQLAAPGRSRRARRLRLRGVDPARGRDRLGHASAASRRLGVTAGASAPEVLVDEIIDAFKARFAATVETVTTAEEAIAFKLPRELREMPAL